MTESPWYKVLSADNTPAHGGAKDFVWPLPTADGPGAWTPEIADVRVCERGYHLTRDPMNWPLVGMRVYEAEGAGSVDFQGDPDHKTAFGRARLLREAPEAVPPYWRAVERFVLEEIPAVRWLEPDGDPSPEWLLVVRPTWSAAWSAAWLAARSAADSAAESAARSAAWSAAWSAAESAAWSAADSAARSAADSAAWSAAESTAWSAAWSAAELTARSAAWSAAESAARSAALMCVIRVCDGLTIAPEHVAHAEAEWRVWQKGYALLGDVDGKLIVYAATEGR